MDTTALIPTETRKRRLVVDDILAQVATLSAEYDPTTDPLAFTGAFWSALNEIRRLHTELDR
jgi:hypothetical protein